MGPYAAADLHAVPFENDPEIDFPVRQYHRGDPTSRKFTAWGETGGSEPRQRVVKAVLEHVNENAKPTIAAVALQRYKEMRENWLNIEK